MRSLQFSILLVFAASCSTDGLVFSGTLSADASAGVQKPQLSGNGAASTADLKTDGNTDESMCVDGADCFDIKACILHGTCQSGQCVAIVNPCDDGNVCTDDACDPKVGCTHLSNEASCTDDDACSGGDACLSGSCKTNSTIVCDDGNFCTTDYCHALNGCVHEVDINMNALPCDDGNFCTTNDVCVGAECAAGKPLNCSDDNACTIDSCSPNEGCVNTYKVCDDKNVWTHDACSDGTCVNSDLYLKFNVAMDYNPAGNKPPVSMSPSLFLGDETLKPFVPNDAWIAYSLISYASGFSLKAYCADKNDPLMDKPHWNAGYVVHVNGLSQKDAMLGGHLITLKIVTLESNNSAWVTGGEQPVLLPLSGTQEYDADNKPIPQSYHSPNLKKICGKMIEVDKK